MYVMGRTTHNDCAGLNHQIVKSDQTFVTTYPTDLLLQKTYLLEAADTISTFYWPLFDKIRHNEEWKDQLSLNINLQECLETQFPQHATRYI